MSTCAPIPGFEGYEASNDGRVRSFWRRGRSGKLGASSHELAGNINRDGYRYVAVKPTGGGECPMFVHRLVLFAFVGPCPDGMQALHGNGDPGDNRLPNLRWGTHAENEDDKERHGRRPRGARHGMAKLSDAAIADIRARRAVGETLVSIATVHGVTHSHVAQICLNKIRKETPNV